MKYYLGIDGGGSKTKYSIADQFGHLLASYQDETCHYQQVKQDVIVKNLKDGIANLCKQVKIQPQDIQRIVYGCAGYGDVKKDCIIIENIVKKAFETIKFDIYNDGFVGLVGSLAADSGINIVAGTGSIGFGYNNDTNQVVSCGGFHQSIGSDEGSAYWLSYQLLHEFTRQVDGRDKKTALYQVVYDYLDLHEDGEIITVIVDDYRLDRGKIAALAILVDKLYQQNDKYAIKFVNQAANELFDIINTIYKKLKFKDKIKVSYTGGVFKMGDKIIEPLAKLLEKNNMQLVKPILSADCGAILLALKNDGISINQEIINNLKEK